MKNMKIKRHREILMGGIDDCILLLNELLTVVNFYI